MDYTFVWERTDIKVAEGEFRVQVNVQGDQIERVSTYYKAPEEFMRKLRERGIKSSITSTLSIIALIITIVLVIIHFLNAYRSGYVNWHLPIRVGIKSSSWPSAGLASPKG